MDAHRLLTLPMPARYTRRPGSVLLASRESEREAWTAQRRVCIHIEGVARESSFLQSAAHRGEARLSRGSGNADRFDLVVQVEEVPSALPAFEVDEAYRLTVTAEGASLSARTSWGALHGLETLLQLVQETDQRCNIPCVDIDDAPRYPWRGLLIDVCRHWIPKDAILRNLDAMAAVKLNVLHLHLTDDQAFRIECRRYPKLHEQMPDGEVFSQEDVREIVAYAAERGIRVVPELDLPGHSLSWVAAYPFLALPGTEPLRADAYEIFPCLLDPTREEVFEFLEEVIADIAGLFPDEYFHIGADEADASAWKVSPAVAAFMRQREIVNYKALEGYVVRRLCDMARRQGKRPILWDDVLAANPPEETVIQVWRNKSAFADATRRGNPTLLSYGWYLSHRLPACAHYAVDPANVLTTGEPVVIPRNVETFAWRVRLEETAGLPEGVVLLYNEGEAWTGWAVFGDDRIPIAAATWDGDHARFNLRTSFGHAAICAETTGPQFRGTCSISRAQWAMTGERIGGDAVTDALTSPREQPVIGPNVWGGEAALWTEWVSAETLDSRLWPRCGAIAERLWSVPDVSADEADLYQRLDALSVRLAERGLTHESYRSGLLERALQIAGVRAHQIIVELCEEIPPYERFQERPDLHITHPLEQLGDAAPPKSRAARGFAEMVDRFVAGDGTLAPLLEATLRESLECCRAVREQPVVSPLGETILGIAAHLEALAPLGWRLLEHRRDGVQPSERLLAEFTHACVRASATVDGARLAIVPAMQKLAEG